MENKNKVGGVVDHRFGENNSKISPEEKMLERFTKERQVFYLIEFQLWNYGLIYSDISIIETV